MKRIAILLCAATLLLSACAKKEIIPPETTIRPETTVLPEITSSAEERITGLSGSGTTEPEESPAAAASLDRVSYGERTGTDLTYTGLAPLPPREFDLAAMRTCLSTATIEHSFGVAKDEKPHEISVAAQKVFDENQLDAVVYDSRATEKTLYLTFDCGYDNGNAERILDTLKEKNVKAAFFCTLPEMQSVPELTARMINEGHIVGNHSVTHPDFSALSHAQMTEEVKGFDDWLREHCGYSARYFRFPMGKYSLDAVAALNAMGYQCVFWSLAYYDWDPDDQPGEDAAFETVVGRLHPGAVILLHAVSSSNADALPRIIDEARRMGYEFRALNER